ncbi:MAG TPA: AAA family ATPase [Rhodopseudomonas sp.]|uniref:bifunctional aminoglycoside phosphotransferase/ATP-binding protein n=1 Tax=Rhodopseudomonas sp. TaxID=1078 RepID=UPI002ED80267
MVISCASDDLQQQIFTFLANPASHGDEAVQVINTHGAAVFLAGDRALKIKRAVRFPYLDYSTLAKRKAACDEEVTVNRMFAPQIYRGVVPITQRDDGRFEIDGGGRVVEWAVEMTRFDEQQTVDHLARHGAPRPALLRDIADVIAASHAAAPLAATAPWIDSISRIIAGNGKAFRAGGFDAAQIDALDALSRAAFARLQPLLVRRGEQGHVRRCHGDLHLANIVVIEGKPVLFDAIEFDPSIASTDVLYDLAFVMMDFIDYDRAGAACVVLNRYLASTSDDHLDALSALPLLMSMRAAIRANVMLSRPARDQAQGAEIRRSAERYFALARRLIAPPPPRLIAIGGLSGTGKSLLARDLAGAIAPLPGAIVLRSDVTRKQLFKVKDTDRLPPEAYRPEVTAEVYATLATRAARIVAQGHSAMVDAVFAREDERHAIAAVAARAQVRFDGLFLTADLATRIDRVSRRVGDASDATAEIAAAQQAFDAGVIDWTLVDAAGTPEQTRQRATVALGGDGAVRSITER